MVDHSIDQREYAQRHPSLNIQLVMTFPFVDLHLNTSMIFTVPRCVLITLEPQSTKHCSTSLLNLHQTLQIKVRRTDACFVTVLLTTRYEVLPYTVHISHHETTVQKTGRYASAQAYTLPMLFLLSRTG